MYLILELLAICCNLYCVRGQLTEVRRTVHRHVNTFTTPIKLPKLHSMLKLTHFSEVCVVEWFSASLTDTMLISKSCVSPLTNNTSTFEMNLTQNALIVKSRMTDIIKLSYDIIRTE